MVKEEELHALVDGQLPDERIGPVLEWLRVHPEDALRVAQWQAQRLQLRRLHREVSLDETPEALSRVVLRKRTAFKWTQALAAAVLLAGGLVLGLGIGSGLRTELPGGMAGARQSGFARDAALAHVAFVPEVKHPVEVAASDEAHLVQWLSKRLGSPLKVPSLQAQGFRLLGGRLLPGEKSPRAQFMFEDSAGRRLTLYLSTFTGNENPGETAFRSARQGALESFYWVEGRFGYALSAEMPASELQGLARVVYQQLDGVGAGKP